jgi:Carboxypeptidase regulatory-like domain
MLARRARQSRGVISVSLTRTESNKRFGGGNSRRRVFGLENLIWLSFALLVFGFPVAAQRPLEIPAVPGTEASAGSQLSDRQVADQRLADQQSSGRISGRVVDQTGVAVTGATVKLLREDESLNQEMLTGDEGQFSFANVVPGPFHLTITSAGFATQAFLGNLRSGENNVVPQIVLMIATAVTEVRVVPPQIEVAEEQIKEQEKQRALGFIPNFYVSYVPNAVPLAPKQKFELAWKELVDPVNFGLTGAIAGIQQAQNDFSGYGQGAQGYAKRYGASYANTVTGTLIGSAILPSLLKQDPRYFYKGTGSKRSRVLYAVANSVICKGDNGHWQANYSGILGGLAAGGISNLYYPAKDRNGAGLTFENALIGIGAMAAANILQEFVIRKLTPNASKSDPGNGTKSFGPIGRMLSSFVHEGD